jgi:methyl-accepting chemotaxis protein
MKFDNFSIKTKLLLMSSALGVLLLVTGALGVYGLKQVAVGYDHVTEINFPNARALASMRFNSTDLSRLYLRFLVPGLTQEDVQRIRGKIDKAINEYQKADKEYNDIPFVPGEQQIYDAQNKVWMEMLPRAQEFVQLYGTNDPVGQKRYQELIQTVLPKLREAHSKAIGELINFQDQEAKKWIQESKSANQRFTWIALVSVSIGTALALAIGYALSTALSRSLEEIASRISSGAQEAASATHQISNSSEELSAAATQQASSLQETSASIEEMSAMVKKNAENSAKSQESAQEGVRTATEGKKIVAEMIDSMGRIGQSNDQIMSQVETSNGQLSQIVQVIHSIGEKTKVINDIVFQTKLLSFNASVEAARAGEHGKGFAVVAEEVGNLALMSGKAANEISGMLASSVELVQKIVHESKSKIEQLMASGKIEVSRGNEIAKQCGTMLDEIVRSVEGINIMTTEIATACGEQSSGIQEINKAMGELDKVTQQNAAASQQTASAAAELSAQTEMLRSTVALLLQVTNGARSSVTPVAQERAFFREPLDKLEIKRTRTTQAERTKPVQKTKRHESRAQVAAVIPLPAKSVQPAETTSVARDIPATNDARFSDI